MCLSKAYLESNGVRELILQEVASLKIEDGNLRLRTLFGDEKSVKASIKQIDFVSNSIVLGSPEKQVSG
jgi:predicted RNA-binding protein